MSHPLYEAAGSRRIVASSTRLCRNRDPDNIDRGIAGESNMGAFAGLSGLVFAGALFVVAHLGISSTGLRGVLVRTLGERGYLGVYSLLAIVTLVYLILTYNASSHAQFLWVPTHALRGIAFAVMPVAMMFLFGGFMVRNPTAVGQQAMLAGIGEGSGLLRITRHPFQWAVVLWATVHIIANGDAASLIFFGSLGTLSLVGTFAIDAKKARTMGEAWSRFAAVTSNVPFAAIAAGRNRLAVAELWLPLGVGLLGYGLVLWGHRYVSGVSLF
jgi:uncharacterized membrane protein